MPVVRLQSLSLIGRLADKAALLEGLQRLGVVHLVPMRAPAVDGSDVADLSSPEDVLEALHYLRDCPSKRHPARPDEPFDLHAVTERALANRRRRQALQDRYDFLERRIRDVEPFGDFEFPEGDALKGQRLWFYKLHTADFRKRLDIPYPYEVLHEDVRNIYLALISEHEPPDDLLPRPRVHIGAKSLTRLRDERDATLAELEECDTERYTLTRWIPSLRNRLHAAEDAVAMARALAGAYDSAHLFAVQGWVADADAERVVAFAKHHGAAVSLAPAQPEDRPPTKLANDDRLGGGEEIVHFYAEPGYRSFDPSAVIFFSFTLFFAMIIADAGYGLVLAALLAVFWRRFGSARQGKRLRVLAAALVGATLVYGVLAGSYFGTSPPPGSLRAHLAVIDLHDFNAMMTLSLIIGALHILLALAVTALRAWPAQDALKPLGWGLGTIGALALYLGAPIGGAALLALGLLLVLLFAAPLPVTGWRDGLRRFGLGLMALTDVTKLFGDVMSYLRLFALGLASASLAITFNDIAFRLLESHPGLGLVMCVLVLLIGHALNLLLAVVSGVVHGLRLNLIEFYRWAVSDEGYPFTPFEKKEIGAWTA